jgi:pimeloyl-ACP methyl ester carboxylesterase
MDALDLEEFAGMLAGGFDIPRDTAHETAHRVDARMRDSILRLYRSAVTVGAEWAPDLRSMSVPAMIFWGVLDPACPVEFGREMGMSVHADRVVELDCNHWTVLQRPAEVATLLQEHWRRH